MYDILAIAALLFNKFCCYDSIVLKGFTVVFILLLLL